MLIRIRVFVSLFGEQRLSEDSPDPIPLTVINTRSETCRRMSTVDEDWEQFTRILPELIHLNTKKIELETGLRRWLNEDCQRKTKNYEIEDEGQTIGGFREIEI